jgi:hypothetical protein
LFVPNVTHLSDAAYQTLAKFKGKIIFVGGDKLLTKNEYDERRADVMKADVVGKMSDWNELLEKLSPSLASSRITPAVTATDEAGKPQHAVQWQCGSLSTGVVVNLYNASYDPAKVKLDRATVDVLTGERVEAGQSMTLQSLDVRLLRCETLAKR